MMTKAECKIYDLFKELGIPAHLDGYPCHFIKLHVKVIECFVEVSPILHAESSNVPVELRFPAPRRFRQRNQ